MSQRRRIFLIVLSFFIQLSQASETDPSPSNTVSYWRRQRAFLETTARLPFARNLANPCGLTNPFAGPASSNPAAAEQSSHRLLSQFLHYHRDVAVNPQERRTLGQEFQTTLQTAKHALRHIQISHGVSDCDGMELQALRPVQDLNQVREFYRALLVANAHLHLAVRDDIDSGRSCLNSTLLFRSNIIRLTGKLETLLCIMIQTGSSAAAYYQTANEVLNSNIYRYFECSARQMRDCLVINYTDNLLELLRLSSQEQERPFLAGLTTSL